MATEKRTRSELEIIKNFVDRTYSRFGNSLMVDTGKKFNPVNPELGYCFKYTSDDKMHTVYKIVTAQCGIDHADFCVLMHEYGHIYLGHLDGIHEELDQQICNVFRDRRGELIERLNKECGIDFADKLIERVIDDPVLNHSLHNIAMDMEVNSQVLSSVDVEEMEKEITTVLPKFQEEYLKYIKDQTDDEEKKKAIDDLLKRMENETKIKLILPERYHYSDGTPFPDNLTYPEYLLLIIQNLDQFVKMMVNIKKGGNGDTSQVSSQDVQDALSGNPGQGQGDGQSGQGQGNGPSMGNLNDLMQDMGMTDGDGDQGAGKSGDKPGDGKNEGDGDGNDAGEPKESPYKGQRGSDLGGENGDQPGGSHKDHRSESRDEADQKRELGEIRSGGGVGCGSGGRPGATRQVTSQDPIDMALDEVILNFKSRVVKKEARKDLVYNYNRGINRTVISPSIRRKTSVSTEPTIVFLIDISGSMDTNLVDRCLRTISDKMSHIGRGLKYNIITWSTHLGEHLQNINPRKPIPRISMGGGTSMAGGMKYFKEHYDEDAILILISDFEDYLQEWHAVEQTMPKYTMYGFNYGSNRYDQKFTYFKVKDFTNGRRH